MNSIKPKSQLEKRLDGHESGEKYYAGQGLILSDNTFTLGAANSATLGGIRVSAYSNVPEGFPQAEYDSGIYKADIGDTFLGLRNATAKQMGGLYLGDGLAPTILQEGETYTNTKKVQLRIDEGLEFIENDETTEDVVEIRQNALGGRAIAAVRATTDKFGTVKLGKRMAIDGADGSVYPVMNGKDGIDVSDGGDISLLIDEEKFKIDSEGKLTTTGESGGLTVEQAVIIQEADASYLLHEYTEIKYIDGNRICYGSGINPIIINGYIAPKKYQDSLLVSYTSMTFEIGGISTSNLYSNMKIYLDVVSTSYEGTSDVRINSDCGSKSTSYTTYDLSKTYITLDWDTIYSPTADFPYGYAYVRVCLWGVWSSGGSVAYRTNLNFYVGFASEAEYNAAVGLTYEPNTLTEVQETITEV